jgi:hypothetical protein
LGRSARLQTAGFALQILGDYASGLSAAITKANNLKNIVRANHKKNGIL